VSNVPVNPNKALWEKGDWTRIAETMRASSEKFVHSLGLAGGDKVLDVGCGDGNTAIPAAKLGAQVVGVDIASNLVAAAKNRAQSLGVSNCQFQEGDACNLHGIADGAHDVVVSIFGAMFAPRPFDVAREFVRVTRPGGKIVMGNWIPNDPTLIAQVLKICSEYTPPPPEGFVSPMTWGLQEHVIERFSAAGVAAESISFTNDTFVFHYSGSPAEYVDEFRKYYGPIINAFDAAEKNGRADELRQGLEQLFQSQNRHQDERATEIPATFLRVAVRV